MSIFDFLKRKKKKEFSGRDYGTQRMVGSPNRIKTTDKPPMQMPKPPGLTPGAKSVPKGRSRYGDDVDTTAGYWAGMETYSPLSENNTCNDSGSSSWSNDSSSSSCYDSGSSYGSSSSYDSGSSSSSYDSGSSSSYDSGSSY